MMKIKNVVVVSVLFCLLMFCCAVSFASEKIHLNSASAVELTEIKGVGDVLARRIIEYRQAHGQFKSLEELANIKGVGDKKLKKITPYLTLSEG